MKDATREVLLMILGLVIAAAFFSAGFKVGYDWKAYTVSLPAER
jgi:hypothetical protein